MVTCLGFLAGKWGGSGFPDALLPLKSDFRLNPNDLTPTGLAKVAALPRGRDQGDGICNPRFVWGYLE